MKVASSALLFGRELEDAPALRGRSRPRRRDAARLVREGQRGARLPESTRHPGWSGPLQRRRKRERARRSASARRGPDPAAVDDDHRVARRLDFRDDVRREEHRPLAADRRRSARARRRAAPGRGRKSARRGSAPRAGGRSRRRARRAGGSPSRACRSAAGSTSATRHRCAASSMAARRALRGHALQARPEPQILAHAQLGVERHLSGRYPMRRRTVERVANRVEPADAHRARGRAAGSTRGSAASSSCRRRSVRGSP